MASPTNPSVRSSGLRQRLTDWSAVLAFGSLLAIEEEIARRTGISSSTYAKGVSIFMGAAAGASWIAT
ncbi:MAG: hypothetical protein JSS43_20095, partial [Proteobacteria bacterium]|nr:hypothetical protein [Pseudomonadota bacterium]